MSEDSHLPTHNCPCLHAPGYRPPRCQCGTYEDKHGKWCANENCRALLAAASDAMITRHGQLFEPTYPHPRTDEEKRIWIAEARAASSSGFMAHDSWPLPEMYPGHYEDTMGLS